MPGTPSAEASTGREEEKNIVNVPEKPRQQTLKSTDYPDTGKNLMINLNVK